MADTEGFIKESSEFLEKLVYSADRLKTLDETFSKKSDAKDERHHFYRTLTLQTKHGFSGKKDAKALAAELDTVKRMNGNKKEGWAKESDRVKNLLLRQQLIDFKSTTAPNRKKCMAEVKSLLHKNLTSDIIPPEQSEEKQHKYPSTCDKQLNTQKLLKKKWDTVNARKTNDDDLRAHFEPVAGAEFLSVQKMSATKVASFLDLMENESTKMKDNVTLLPFFKQDLEQNKAVFGSRKIHLRIIARDMELLGKNSKLLQNDESFLEAWAAKLDKVGERNPDYNDEGRTKFLAKLKKWMDQYVKGGAPSLKALILYNLLADNERAGKYDKEVFREYLSVPKETAYNGNAVVSKKWTPKKMARFDYTIDTDALYAIENDEKLVYRYFRNLFKKNDAKETWKKWSEFVNADYVKAVMCEAKMMNDVAGKGSDLKKMYTKVRGKYAVQELEKKVVIEVEQQNQRYFEVNDSVSIKVGVKNVSSLTVNVYALKQKNYYMQHGREIDIDMNLDGLTANYITTKEYKENSFLLRTRTIDLKELKEKRGVFLVDIVGNGKRARCLIRKGSLRYIARQEFDDENKDNDLNYVLTVLGEKSKAITKSRITINGVAYLSDDKGNVHVPFAAEDQASAPIILEDLARGEESATLQFMDYRTENYSTESGLYLDRESLLESQTCKILIRPNLFLNEQPVSCAALQDCSLLVRAYVGCGGNADDNSTRKQAIKKFRLDLSDSRETTVDYDVPAELRKVELTLTGKIWVGSQKKFVSLSNSSTFEVNAIDDSNALGQCVLVPDQNKYILRVLGKNAEPLPTMKLLVKLKHRYFAKPLEFKLQTDKDGAIKLGELPDIESFEVLPMNDVNSVELFEKQCFVVPKNTVNIPSVMNVTQGSDVLIPLITDNIAPRCDVYDAHFIRIYENVQFNAGYIKIINLPAGNFVAMIRDTQIADVKIHVSKGVGCCGHTVSADRIVELSELKSLQIVQTKGDRGGGYKVKLDGYNSKSTRVHAISSYGVPQFDIFNFLASPTSTPLVYNFRQFPLEFTGDEDVSAEESYIYKRREAVKSAVGDDEKKDAEKEDSPGRRFGNVLNTPSLLLSGWTAEAKKVSAGTSAEEKEQSVESAEKVIVKEKVLRSLTRYALNRGEVDPANLDMLGFPARMSLNLVPDKSGVVSIPHDILEANHNLLTIVALDDNNTSVKYERLKPVSKVPYSDTRLLNGLSPTEHFSEVRDVLLKQKDESETFTNWPSTTLETYDDFSDVFELYFSIADEKKRENMKADLIDFRFLANWGKMSNEQKMAKYNDFACNELHFFLQNKDAAFFKSVVLPVLRNRLQKSFVDHFLLGNEKEVKRYERTDLFHTLNTLERILLASVVGGKLAENTVRNLRDEVSLNRGAVQEFNSLFQQALNAKQFEVTSLANTELLEQGVVAAAEEENVADASGDLSRKYQESRYYKVDPTSEGLTSLVKPNAFWRDYADFVLAKGGSKGFLSKNFGFAASNTTEALLALSVIALPFRGDHLAPTMEIFAADGSTKLKSYADGATVKVTVNGPTMLLVRSLQITAFESSSLAVSTNYFDPVDRFELVDFEKVDKFVDQQRFVCGKTYGCRVVITNVSSVTYQVSLLCQIPTGAIPVNGGFRTKNLDDRQIESYATSSLEYYFYFPQIGEFTHYPAHVSRNGSIIGYSLSKTAVCVMDAAAVVDRDSWAYMTSSKPEAKDVLEHVKNSTTLRANDLSKLAWRCADEKFFLEITNVLKRKQLYEPKIWKYSLVHNCENECGEYLRRSDKFMKLLAPALTAENTGDPLLVNYNAYERGTYRHVEFFKNDENILGLFNTRVHSNRLFSSHARFAAMYRAFLIRCLYRSYGLKTMSVDDQLCAIFYLVAQNEIKKATSMLKAMDAKSAKKASPMMFDYVQVFMTFFESDAEMVKKCQDTVHKWLAVKLPTTKRALWTAVKQQITELQNRTKTLDEFTDAAKAKAAKMAMPKLSFSIDAAKKMVRIKSKNVQSVTANFYAINIEQLFSNSPFSREAGKDALMYVQPSVTLSMATVAKVATKKKDDDSSDEDSDDEEAKKKLAGKKKDPNAAIESVLAFPKGLDEKSNFVLELFGDATEPKLRVSRTQYNNSLSVEFNGARGDMFVGNYSKFPVVQAYVKVYLATQMNPNGFFLKDGYTDLRGRFDYLSSNVALPADATKVAVLVVSEACGANIYYADIQK